jgi:glucose-1-phosphate adenylyltransferase
MAFVLAGGRGTRLYPLTADHAKPALTIAPGRRIVDFVLSNLVNSGVAPIYILAQYKPRSLIEHVRGTWAVNAIDGAPQIAVLLPDRNDEAWLYKGTADAVYQNIELLTECRPDIVAVFAADHVYRMDVRQMMHFHLRREADVTVAAIPVPIEVASSFGVLRAGPSGELQGFEEKPLAPAPMPGNSTQALASMGNYLFRPHVLVELLEDARQRGGVDFGLDILPWLPGHCGVYAYDFSTNWVPGLRPHEARSYWRDVGTPDAYHAARADVRGPTPRFDLDNAQWPIGPARLGRAAAGPPHLAT